MAKKFAKQSKLVVLDLVTSEAVTVSKVVAIHGALDAGMGSSQASIDYVIDHFSFEFSRTHFSEGKSTYMKTLAGKPIEILGRKPKTSKESMSLKKTASNVNDRLEAMEVLSR